jgi:hypothetical protein
MLLRVKILTVLLMLVFTVPSFAQYEDTDHNHIDKPNEIGVAIGAVYGFNEESVATELHLHYTRMLPGKFHWLGFGVAFESILDLNKQFAATAGITLRPLDLIWISAGPGFTYFGETDSFTFSSHFEVGLEFNAGFFHLGPMVEYAIAADDQYLMFGLHIGVPF